MRIGQDWAQLSFAATDYFADEVAIADITRGRDGMQPSQEITSRLIFPSRSDQVTDVTGAGDTVIATFTAALASGANTEDAAHLAQYAGGIVVMKRGNATVSQQNCCIRLTFTARDQSH